MALLADTEGDLLADVEDQLPLLTPAMMGAGANPRVVLLVDDDADTRAIYGRVLMSIGYRVLEAMTGRAAILLAQATRPDVVVLDLGLPDMDGLDVTRALRGDPRTCGISIAILTAYVSNADRSLALAAGCNLYLAKPLLPRALVSAVQSLTNAMPLMRPAEAPAPQAPTHGRCPPEPQSAT